MSKLNSLKEEINKILLNSPVVSDVKHSELVLRWVIKLKPDADEALKIAAISHDLDRGVTKITEKDLKDYSKIDKFKKEHSIRSSKYICDILKKYNYSKKIIDKVRYLVENHEFGGNDEANILTNADSLAYFESDISPYLKRNGKKRTKEKIRFMYKRMSEEAKNFVRKIKFKNKQIAKLVDESMLK